MKKDDLSAHVYDVLKERLVTCQYAPNSMLNEVKISTELGCSRTPTREAIIRLEREGFLEVIPKKGIQVTGITVSDIVQIFQTRKAIEPIGLELGRNNLDKHVLEDFRQMFINCKKDILESYKIDSAFHMYLIEVCRNKFIINMMHSVLDRNARVTVAQKDKMLLVDSQQEHTDIIDALIEDDIEKAKAALLEHIEHCRIAALDSIYDRNMDATPALYKTFLRSNN